RLVEFLPRTESRGVRRRWDGCSKRSGSRPEWHPLPCAGAPAESLLRFRLQEGRFPGFRGCIRSSAIAADVCRTHRGTAATNKLYGRQRPPLPGCKVMNRKLTNTIRFVMDEIVPPFIRDSRVFMYPFYRYWFNGQNVSRVMDFKSYFHEMSDNEIQGLYCNLECRSIHRASDLNGESLDFILSKLDIT